MKTAKEYLETIQGLIIFLEIKKKAKVSLKQLNHMDALTFNYLVEEFLEARDELLALQHEMEEKVKRGLNEELIRQGEVSNLTDRIYSRELPSRFQQRGPYELLLTIFKSVQKACVTLKLPAPPPNLILATLPTGKVNAVAIRHKASGDYIIAFESQLMDFFFEFIKLITLSMPYSQVEDSIEFRTDQESVKAHLESRPEIQLAFDILIWNYINGKRINNQSLNLATDVEKGFCSYIVLPAEIFIMGHEYGHIICKHHEKSVDVEQLNLDSEEINQSWENEYEADKVGLVISIQAMLSAKFDIDFSLIGATVYFILKEFVDKAVSIANDGHEMDTKIYDSHPPAGKRIENMKKEFLNHFSEEQLKIAEVLPDAITKITNVLWEKTKPLLYAHYKRKAGQS